MFLFVVYRFWWYHLSNGPVHAHTFCSNQTPFENFNSRSGSAARGGAVVQAERWPIACSPADGR